MVHSQLFNVQEWVVYPFFEILVQTRGWISIIFSTIAIAIKNSLEKGWCKWTINLKKKI